MAAAQYPETVDEFALIGHPAWATIGLAFNEHYCAKTGTVVSLEASE
jgi:hypothetical protein